MRYPDSEMNSSENKKEGLKYITQAVFQLLKENKACTYAFICKNIIFPNVETLNRRIYDVLNVMKAVRLVDKRGKRYFLVSSQDDINKKRDEIRKLMEMKKVFEFIVARNAGAKDIHMERLYLPFMVISTSRKADIHCETNEERTFFTFRSDRPLKVNEDLDILREIYGRMHSGERVWSPLARRHVSPDDEPRRPGRMDHEDSPGLDPFFFNF